MLKDNNTCPLHAVHTRLDDLHRHWHGAEEAYFDPESFRVAIQTAIITSRTVTFIIQNNKSLIPDFDTWYSKWQAAFKDNRLMRWMVDARNRIEKQGDLEAHSFVRAEIVASYLQEGPVVEVPAQLFSTPEKMVRGIPNSFLGDHIRKNGVLRIHRKWIENTLPEFELLDAVAIAYGELSQMLDDAHLQMGLEKTHTKNIETGESFDSKAMGGRLPCMIGHSDARTLNVWIADGSPIEVSGKSLTVSREEAEEASRRYGIEPKGIFGDGESGDATLKGLFMVAMKMFLKDKYHDTTLFLLNGSNIIELSQIAPFEHGEKYLLMRHIAHQVVRKGADGVILIGEVWMAPFSDANPYRRAAEAPDKEEALVATLVTKYGEPKQWAAFIRRVGERVSLDSPTLQEGGAPFIFAPCYEAWGRPIPSEWGDQMDRLRARDQDQ